MGLGAIDIGIIVLYLLLVLGVGTYAGRGIKTFRDFSIGSYKFPDSAMVGTIAATWIGAELLFGLSEKVYEEGIVWILIFFAGTIMEMVVLSRLAPRISRFKGHLTPAEILGSWYGDKRVRIISGICVILLSAGTIGVQIAALGIMTQELLGMPALYGMVLCTALVVLYSSLGGMKAVVATDTLQFAFFIVAIPLVAALLLQKAGGIHEMVTKAPAEHCSLLPGSNPGKYIFLLFFFMIPYADPTMVQRALAAKNEEQIASSFKAAAIIFALFYPILGTVALATSAIKSDLEGSTIIYYTVSHFLPIGIKGLVIAGIMAVIMSTASSEINISGVTIIHDIVGSLKKDPISDKAQLAIIKITTFIVGALAILFATTSESIIDLLIHSYMLWGPIMIVPLYACFVGVKANSAIFITSAVIGMIVTFMWLAFGIEEIPEVLPGLIANLICFVGMTIYYYKRKPEQLCKTGLDVLFPERGLRRIKLSKLISGITYKNLCGLILNYLPAPSNLVKFSARKVHIFGAQYRLFGFFAVTFYIINYALWSSSLPENSAATSVSVLLQLVGCILAAGVIVHDIWPAKWERYLPLYWHFTLMYSLAFMTTFLYLCHEGDTPWLINISVSLFLLAVLVDWISFVSLAAIGASLAYGGYAALFGKEEIYRVFGADNTNLLLYLYMVLFSSVVGILFSRNRELVQVVFTNKKLKEALAVKTEILDNISHETRTPIQGVLGMSSALVGSWQHMNEERRYSAISTIHESSKRLMSFVDNLVDLSKYKQGKAKFELKQVHFRSILEEVLKEVELFYMPNRNIQLKVAIADGVKDNILGDEYKLTQLLRNVIGNAFKYMEEGELSISLSNQDDQLLLCVEDEGVGIPEAELEEIFEPFIQSSYTKTGAGGTGVGLTVARDIAVGHSGRIWAENRSPKGARFCIMLPIID